MAGLAGSLSSRGLPIPEVVSRMLAAAPHRGISELTVTKGACTLGVVGAGPEASLHSGDGLAAAFVGRLDNGPELAAEADLAGDEVTPAAVVAALFGRLRDRAPARLRGAYAAVVTDGTTLWGFRDHVGFETLFCAERSGEVRMASEAKQVAAGLSTPREPDLDTLRRIFYVNVEDHTRTSLTGVRRVLAGTIAGSSGESIRWRRYWDPSSLLETARLSADEIAEGFEEHMRRATARVLVGEDAVSLSGGIDSPAIAALAARLGFRTILTGNLAEQVMSMQQFLISHLVWRGQLPAVARYIQRERADEVPWRRIARQVVPAFVPRWAMAGYMRYHPALRTPDWLDKGRVGEARGRHGPPRREKWG